MAAPEECIVNVGIKDNYVRGSKRMIASVAPYGIHVISWQDKLPPDSPTHQEQPYAFKPYAFKAARAAGHRYVLWCDSAMVAIRDPRPIFNAIRRDGCFFRPNGFPCGQWATDRCLQLLGLTRDEAMKIYDFAACCMGLDLGNDRTLAWFDRWIHHATSGAYQGDWRNDRQQCSADSRCSGHRHDQVVGSILRHQLGLPFNEEDLFQYPPRGWKNLLQECRSSCVFVNCGCP